MLKTTRNTKETQTTNNMLVSVHVLLRINFVYTIQLKKTHIQDELTNLQLHDKLHDKIDQILTTSLHQYKQLCMASKIITADVNCA